MLPEYIQRSLRRITGTRQATIDTIEPGAIAVSPRRPIDRFDVGSITEVLDLATKIGAVLLDSGTAARDTQTQVEFVASAYGLDDVDVDVTYNKIMASARRGATLPPITTMEQVSHRSLDFTRLADVDRLIRHIRNSGITPATAHQMVDKIIAAPHPYPHWVATIAWGVMASGVSLLLGGRLLGAVLAFLTTITIVSVNRRVNRLGVPVFFQQVIGGFIAVVPAAVVSELSQTLDIELVPSRVIAAGIVVLLSGLPLVGSLQDAITGAPITGVARFFELLLMTAGIIAGVGTAIRLLEGAGIYLPALTTLTRFGAVDLPVQITGGAIASAAYALASYAKRRAIPVAFLSGAIGTSIALGVLWLAPFGPVIANGAAAVVVGLVGGLLARRALTPPQVVAIAGITPLLPGLAVYRGLYGLLSEQTLSGITWMASALGTGCALAAGVTLGEVVARMLRRPSFLPEGRPFARGGGDRRRAPGRAKRRGIPPGRAKRRGIPPGR